LLFYLILLPPTTEHLFALTTAKLPADTCATAVQELKRALAESQRRVDIALELLGERNERIEQLEDDIQVGR
jgi:hypothetical protein